MADALQNTYPERLLFRLLIIFSLMTVGALAEPTSLHLNKALRRTAQSEKQIFLHSLRSAYACTLELVRRYYVRAVNGRSGNWGWVQLMALCSLAGMFGVWRMRKTARNASPTKTEKRTKGASKSVPDNSSSDSLDAESTDPGLLKKHSTFKSYTTSSGTYPCIRTFYRPHPQADKLPSIPTPLPLLLFIHGLGGSLAQFNSLLTSLVSVAPCLGIDLPGCGLSKFEPRAWENYTPSAMVELLAKVIEEHCQIENTQGIVLIGHSMGCSLSALLVSRFSSAFKSNIDILGLVAVCPKASPFSDEEAKNLRRLLRVPTPIFNLWRMWDRRGGPESTSVARLVGPDADMETKRLQERYNAQSRTAVWRRMAWGLLPRVAAGPDSKDVGGLLSLELWGSLQVPLFLIAGEADNMTKPEEVAKISQSVRDAADTATAQAETMDSSGATCVGESGAKLLPTNSSINSSNEVQDHSTANTETTVINDVEKDMASEPSAPTYSRKSRVLKTSILPAPASHALLYDPTTYRTLAGLIHTFLYDHVDSRLSLGWQLQHLSTDGKWDVKNLAKWQAVKPVSEPIAGIFRALKTLRQIDATHRPDRFVAEWRAQIKAVIDISHESPVYDPKNLDEGGIEYHKFPTVSKIPPTPEETRDFNKLIDRLRTKPSGEGQEDALIGVHCHYGFNRTGFFLCCYLIETEGYGVQQAIDEFAAHRPPGIRHEHFLDTLFVRYCVGLKRAPTL